VLAATLMFDSVVIQISYSVDVDFTHG